MVDSGRREKIQADNDYFKSLMDLIPARVYFDQDTRDELQLSVDDDAQVTDNQDDEPRRKQKKLEKKKSGVTDPLQSKTVTQLQQELDMKQSHKSDFTQLKTKKKKKHSDGKGEKKEFKSVTTSLEELREKLHARIDDLKGKRGQLNPEEWLERKRLKRKQSKLKLKMKRKKEKLNLVKGDHSGINVPNGIITSPAKPVFNKDGKIVFSKFDFTDTGNKTKTAMPDLTGKDYKKILENLEKRKEKVKKLQETDVLAARELQKKSTWQMAIGKAEGVKIKDDPELLKKALKRKEKRKEKNKKGWDSRNQQVEEKKKDRQEKRQKNIDSRKQTKFKNKIKKAGKRGRIAGF